MQRIAKKRSARSALAKKLAPLETRQEGNSSVSITYELRRVLCGKPKCRKFHGPYWYAFWKARGRVRTAYIGKRWRSVAEKCPEKLGPEISTQGLVRSGGREG